MNKGDLLNVIHFLLFRCYVIVSRQLLMRKHFLINFQMS